MKHFHCYSGNAVLIAWGCPGGGAGRCNKIKRALPIGNFFGCEFHENLNAPFLYQGQFFAHVHPFSTRVIFAM